MIELEYLESIGYKKVNSNVVYDLYEKGDGVKYYHHRRSFRGLSFIGGIITDGSLSEVLDGIGESGDAFKLWKRSRVIKKILNND